MLDEPTEGVWHGVIEEIAERLEQLARDIAVLIVEQHVELALRVSQYCYVMDRGRIALEGPSDKVRDDPEPGAPARAVTRNAQPRCRLRPTLR